VHVLTDGHHDAGDARCLAARRDDQPGVGLGLIVDGLDEDEMVERLDRPRLAAMGVLEALQRVVTVHGGKDTRR
jgi:hypothetical protein